VEEFGIGADGQPDPSGSDDWDPVHGPDDTEAWLASLPDDIRAEVLAQRPSPWTASGEAVAAAFAAGGFFDAALPGSGLGEALASVTAFGHAGMNDSELCGVLRGWQRQVAYAQAGLAAAVIALTGRRAAGSSRALEHLTDEVAVELTMTGRSAGRLVDVAGGLARLSEVHGALLSGVIDWARACVFVDELAVLDDAAARQVAARLADPAAGWTTGQLRAALARAVLAIDPAAAERRKKQARAGSRVEVWAEPSGNAALAGRELRPAHVIAIDAQLTGYARWLKSCGVPGTIDQLRSLAYTTLLSGRELGAIPADPCCWPHDNAASAAGQAAASASGSQSAGAAADSVAKPGAAPPDLDAGSRLPELAGTIHLTMPMSAWLGGGQPGGVAGHGPADAATSRELARLLARDPRTRWCLTLTGPAGLAVGHACAGRGRGPGHGQPALRWAAGLREHMQLLETGTCRHPRATPSYTPPAALRHLIEVRQRNCSAPGCRRSLRLRSHHRLRQRRTHLRVQPRAAVQKASQG
jgi:hypothetical protein